MRSSIIKSLTGIIFLFQVFATSAQTITILEARQKTIGSTVTVVGVITSTEFGTQKYIQDPTAGIALYDAKLASVLKGDSVLITGVTKDYNGELEISPVNTVQVISSGNQLPAPKTLTFSSGFSETYQGQLVRFNGITFKLSGTFDAGTSGKNYIVIQNGTEKEARIKPGITLVGTPIPSGKVDIIGVMSHYKNTYGTDIYQLYPRGKDDIILPEGPVFTTELLQSDIKHNGFRVSFSTQDSGNTILKYGLTKSLEMTAVVDPNFKLDHSVVLTGLSPATFYYVQALTLNKTNDTSVSSVYVMSTASLSSGKILVYFNNPVDHSFADTFQAVYLNKTIDDTLAAYISRAKSSIDVSVYNINNQNLSASISSALNDAFNRGVVVRVIADGSTACLGLNDLTSGIKVLRSPTSASYGIMHNKFLVMDVNSAENAIVWTGSTNLTDDQIHTDKNNVVIIQDQTLAKAYTMEFEEMWGSSTSNPNPANSKFGPFKSNNTPHNFIIGGIPVQLFFSPSDGVNAKIASEINNADKDIYFATYVFTRADMANPIKNRYQAGVYAAGIIGEISGSNSGAWDILQPVLDSNIKNYTGSGVFHHKYAIIDQSDPANDPVVITGSHNWSRSADEQNDENTLFIHNASIANIFLQEWAKRFTELGGKVFVGVPTTQVSAGNDKIENAMILDRELMVSYFANNDGQISLSLIDLSGKVIFQRDFSVLKGENRFTAEIPSMDFGLTILKIVSGESQSVMKMIAR